MKRGMRIRLRVFLAVTACAVVVAGVLVANRLLAVHQMTADWTLWPKEVPTRVQYYGRAFICGPNPKPRGRTLDGLTVRGKSAGGADIYAADPLPGESVVTYIAFSTPDGVITCDLSGGP